MSYDESLERELDSIKWSEQKKSFGILEAETKVETLTREEILNHVEGKLKELNINMTLEEVAWDLMHDHEILDDYPQLTSSMMLLELLANDDPIFGDQSENNK